MNISFALAKHNFWVSLFRVGVTCTKKCVGLTASVLE